MRHYPQSIMFLSVPYILFFCYETFKPILKGSLHDYFLYSTDFQQCNYDEKLITNSIWWNLHKNIEQMCECLWKGFGTTHEEWTLSVDCLNEFHFILNYIKFVSVLPFMFVYVKWSQIIFYFTRLSLCVIISAYTDVM